MLKYALTRGYELGKTYGVRKGIKVWREETGMVGAVAIITAIGAILIGLYVIAIVVGVLGTQVTSGNILMSARWNTTISNIDVNAGSTFNIANILPIAVVGVGIMTIVIGAFAGR